MNKKFLLFIIIFTLISHVFTLDQGPTITPLPGGNFGNLINNLKNTVLGILWTIALTFTIIMFVLAGFQYMTAKGDPSKVSEANKSLVWGVAGATVIVLAWSVIAVVKLQFQV